MYRAQLDAMSIDQLQEEAQRYRLPLTEERGTLIDIIMTHLERHGPADLSMGKGSNAPSTAAKRAPVTSVQAPGNPPDAPQQCMVNTTALIAAITNPLQQMQQQMLENQQTQQALFQLLLLTLTTRNQLTESSTVEQMVTPQQGSVTPQASSPLASQIPEFGEKRKSRNLLRMPPKHSSIDTEVLWSDIAGRILVNAISYPIEYAKVLIQIGYEPIPPKPTVTLFGKPALKLPNAFTYIKHIKNLDGFTGCYRGLVPKVCSYTVSTIACDKTLEYLQSNSVEQNEEEDDEDERVRRKRCMNEIIRDVISRTVAIIVSHPLEVISLRMMAQFVGRETKYSSVFGSFLEIYKENGILGYYAGLIPRVIGSVAVIVLTGISTYAINNYVIQEPAVKPYTTSTMKFVATTVMYPFLVVSHCMAVNDCGLIAGVPPYMPIYKNWLHCWTHLSTHNQLKRGSSLLWRYYTGPQMLLNGKLIPIMSNNFYQPSS